MTILQTQHENKGFAQNTNPAASLRGISPIAGEFIPDERTDLVKKHHLSGRQMVFLFVVTRRGVEPLPSP